MKFKNQLLSSLVLFLVFPFIMSCSKTNDIFKTPVKIYSEVNIPDGEYLQYGNYVNGKKHSDYYLVTKKITDTTGKTFYKIYFKIIPVSATNTVSDHYTNWPAYLIIDPRLGSVLESGGNLKVGDISWAGQAGMIYWHYQLNQEKGTVDYINRIVKKDKTYENKVQVKINKKLPSEDMWMDLFFGARFMDIPNKGSWSLVIPAYFNVPMVETKKETAREEIQTKAGTFKTIKYEGVINFDFPTLLDCIRSAIVNPDVIKAGSGEGKQEPYTYYVEDSPRRLIIKQHTVAGAGDYILEAISYVE